MSIHHHIEAEWERMKITIKKYMPGWPGHEFVEMNSAGQIDISEQRNKNKYEQSKIELSVIDM